MTGKTSKSSPAGTAIAAASVFGEEGRKVADTANKLAVDLGVQARQRPTVFVTGAAMLGFAAARAAGLGRTAGAQGKALAAPAVHTSRGRGQAG